jgi:hypothetical protein
MPLLHCLLIYYTCDINICVENGSWPTYAIHSVLPLEPGVTELLEVLKLLKILRLAFILS